MDKIKDGLIFLGDIAHPFKTPPEWGDELCGINKVVNLEGAIYQGDRADELLKKNVLFNHSSIVDKFIDDNVVAACLANNHMFDLDQEISKTRDILGRNGIKSFGAGENLNQSSEEVLVGLNDEYVLIAFGWGVIQCQSANENRSGVNPFDGVAIINKAKELRSKYKDKKIIFNFHWNYELELYPQPAHRKLAFDLIDVGVDCIVGHHPHVVNGIELYKGKPIVYSLGNWWIPNNKFYDGKISYSQESEIQLAFQYSDTGNSICHWFEKKAGIINYISSTIIDSEMVKKFTPYENMSHDDYYEWFKKNRVKNKFLPVYRDANSMMNYIKDVYVKIRHLGVLIIKGL